MELYPSVWQENCQIPARQVLTEDIKAQVAVIGAGLAGLLIAWLLQQAGFQVVILEAGKIAGGVTAHTTAKVTLQHRLLYADLIRKIGFQTAVQYARAQEAALLQYRQLIASHQIDCHWQDGSAYVYATQPQTLTRLEAELKAAQRLGIQAKLTQPEELPFPIQGALCFANQGKMDPLKLCRALAADLKIYEGSRVQRVEVGKVTTEQGTLSAPKIIVATHFPFIDVPGWYFLRLHQQRAYVLALKGAGSLKGMYLDGEESGYSLRSTDERLLLGGTDHRTGSNPRGDNYQQLELAAAKYYPRAQVVGRWSAQDCMSLDSMPYIGSYAKGLPGVYVACGFNKWGMTGSMAAALQLRDLLTGQVCPWAQVFRPGRFHWRASIDSCLQNGWATGQAFARRLQGAQQTAESLAKGEGGIVQYRGQKVGGYRDPLGGLFLVSLKCPHLGCGLQWNPGDRSWDCPCHGSRFDYQGNGLDGPAQKGIGLAFYSKENQMPPVPSRFKP